MTWAAAFLALLLGAAQVTGQDVRTVPSVDDVSIAYEVRGPSMSDVTVVLIHGWSNDRTFWEPHFSNLTSDFQVVALDLAGFGESGANRTEWTMDTFGDDVRAVVEDLDSQNAVLVGFSLGGPVALEAALDIPNRVAGVILVDVLHDPTSEFSEEAIQGMVRSWRNTWGGPDWAAFRDTPPSLVEEYLSKVPETPPAHWWISLEAVFRWMNDQAIRTLRQIQVSVAAINSDRVPTNVNVYRQYVPSFEVREMEGLSHLGVLWQDVDIFDQHLRELVHRMIEP